MTTNSNIPPQKKVVSVEILHLDELGYGPKGEHTRQEWRKECLASLMYGDAAFKYWQEQILKQISDEYKTANFGCVIQLDATKVRVDVVGVHKFSEPSLIPNHIPRYSLDFSGYEFIEPFLFSQFEFLLPVIFSWTKFFNRVSFEKSIFNKNVDFVGTIFLQQANFANVYFLNPVNFSNAAIDGYADFSSINVEKTALFSQIHFSESANFNKSKFTEISVFKDTYFNSFTNFSNVIFLDRANFQSTTFNTAANFRNAIFNQQCEFDNTFNSYSQKWSNETVFNAHVDFENTTFKNVGHFERVQFTNFIPSFLGVDTATTRLEFSSDYYFTKTDISEDAIKRLGLLKRLADEHGQTDQALNFNALELRAKALQPSAGRWFRWFTRLYEITSDYGRSFTKPLKYYLILLGVVFFLALGNALYFSPKNCNQENLRVLSDLWRDDMPCDISATKPDDKIRLNGYRAAAEYTVYRAAGILDFSDNGKATDAVARRLFGQSYEPGWMRFVGLIKAIASTALLFLAALGLRNKYRIK